MWMRCAHLDERNKDAAANRRKARIEKAASPFASTRPAIPGTLVPGQEVSDG